MIFFINTQSRGFDIMGEFVKKRIIGYWTSPLSKPENSAAISCWVTSDPAESRILIGRNLLCTDASEYNP